MVTENNWAVPAPWIIIPLICLRLLRGGFSQPQLMYIPVAVACLAAAFDLKKVIDIEYNGKVCLFLDFQQFNIFNFCSL